MISRGSLTFEPTDSMFCAEYYILVEIKRGDSTLTKSEYSRLDKAKSLEVVQPTQKLPEETSFHIKSGNYTISVSVTDLKSGEIRRRDNEITIEPFSWKDLNISDIEFASSIKRVGGKGPFTKNQLQVIPHAENLFGGDVSTVYYYTEIYNLNGDEADKQYAVKREIYDEDNIIFTSLPIKKRDQKAKSVVEVDMFSVNTIPTGTYTLKLEVTDGVTGKTASAAKRFWVLKPGEEVSLRESQVPDVFTETINAMSSEEIDKELDYIRYITSRDDERILKKVRPEARNKFLFEFWNNRDSSGRFRTKYLTRIEEANIRYGTKIYEGWKTDRGRALIIYGEPDNIERRFFDIGMPESEIWSYDQLEGGVVFFFTDLKGSGDLQQVYSSMRGEYIDAGWVQDMQNRNPNILMDLRR